VLVSTVTPLLDALIPFLRAGGHDVAAVIAARRGPGGGSSPFPPPGDATMPPGLDVLSAKDKHAIAPMLRLYEPDVMLCWGFPWKLPAAALAVPRLGSINHHPGPLPRHRGPIPFAWTFRSGDPAFGLTWHYMDAELDTGNILAQTSVPVEDTDCQILDFAERLSSAALALLPEVLAKVVAGDPGTPQDEAQATWAGHFEDDDYAEVDWTQPARSIHNQVRAWSLTFGLSGFDGPRATLDGKRVRLLRTSLTAQPEAVRIECGDGPLWVVAAEPL
jgi:methionyl-tRNA formyltransferase